MSELILSRRLMIGGIAAAATTAGCDSKSKTAISLQSPWVNDAEFIGYFVAQELKYYEEQKLNFTYLPGGPDIVADTRVLAKAADIALTTPDFTIKAIVSQKAPFKIIGTQYQKSPLGIVSLKKNGIREPKDLVGKTVAVPPANVVTYEAFLTINGIDKEKVRRVPYQYDPTPLLLGEVDATLDFVTNVPYTIQLKGEEPTTPRILRTSLPHFNVNPA